MSQRATQFDRPHTLSGLVRRACAIVDPDATDPLLGGFERRFEDADQPVNAVLESLDEGIPSAVANWLDEQGLEAP